MVVNSEQKAYYQFGYYFMMLVYYNYLRCMFQIL
jgi:hypothetical protein